MSANHVERYVLARSHTVERVTKDYGYDLIMYTFDPQGRYENGEIKIQLKATDHINVINKGATVAFKIDIADYNLWIGEPLPVILVVFDAQKQVAYWIHVQPVIRAVTPKPGQKKLMVHLPLSNVVNDSAVNTWQALRDAFFAQLRQNRIIP